MAAANPTATASWPSDKWLVPFTRFCRNRSKARCSAARISTCMRYIRSRSSSPMSSFAANAGVRLGFFAILGPWADYLMGRLGANQRLSVTIVNQAARLPAPCAADRSVPWVQSEPDLLVDELECIGLLDVEGRLDQAGTYHFLEEVRHSAVRHRADSKLKR